MAKARDELVNPMTGLRTIFQETAQETGGELLQVDWIGDPGWTPGSDYVHLLGYRAEYPYPYVRQSKTWRAMVYVKAALQPPRSRPADRLRRLNSGVRCSEPHTKPHQTDKGEKEPCVS